MAKTKFVFTKEMGRLLQQFRKSARLTQKEIAQRLGLTKIHISHLENGEIVNPPIGTILHYLKACQTPWTKFFQKLSEIDFKIEHEKVMRQVYPAPFDKKSKDTTTSCECDMTQPDKRGGVEMPSSLTPSLRQKIDRDTALYETKIQYPKTPFQSASGGLDWERTKIKIDKKVKTLLFNYKLDENAKRPYFTLTNEFIANYDTGQIPTIFQKHWQARILNRPIIEAIRKIVYQTVKTEQKRLKKQKVLPSEKFRKMAGSFLRYRIKIEPIETEVQKKLGEYNVPIAQNQAYKDFVRECYSALKKYYHKDPSLLTQKFAEITKAWKQMGLKDEVMEKVKDTTISVYKEILLKIIVK